MEEAHKDLVARWIVPHVDGLHTVEFEHGTTTGRRVVRLDGKEISRRKIQFRLVGAENFQVGAMQCSISVEPHKQMSYCYELQVDGRDYKRFMHAQGESLKLWQLKTPAEERLTVALDRNDMEVFVGGKPVKTTDEFCDDGAILHFLLAPSRPAQLRTSSTGTRVHGVDHSLIVDGRVIAPLEFRQD